MPAILALDTSTQACSCALSINGRISESFEIIPRQHANQILPMISQLMEAHSLSFGELDAIAYGQGPGSFTGLRIAAGVTQGIAMAASIPVVPVSSLASIARQVRPGMQTALVFSTLDARIDEVYWGLYRVDSSGVELLGSEGLCKPENLPNTLSGNPGSIIGVGSGMEFMQRMPDIYSELISDSQVDLFPRAATIVELAENYLQKGVSQAPEDVNPVYLRDKVTHS